MQDTEVLVRARALLKETLSEKRAGHVLAVEEETEALVGAFGLEDAREELCLSALLHDITKEKSVEAQLQLCREYGIILRDQDLRTPKGLHAITAAGFARREFDLADEFCDAIRYHTTGRAGMTTFDKILFLADYIEKTRTWAPCQALRTVFWRDMEKAKSEEEKLLVLSRTVRLGIDSTLQDLIEGKKYIHPDTVSARNDLVLAEQNAAKA